MKSVEITRLVEKLIAKYLDFADFPPPPEVLNDVKYDVMTYCNTLNKNGMLDIIMEEDLINDLVDVDILGKDQNGRYYIVDKAVKTKEKGKVAPKKATKKAVPTSKKTEKPQKAKAETEKKQVKAEAVKVEPVKKSEKAVKSKAKAKKNTAKPEPVKVEETKPETVVEPQAVEKQGKGRPPKFTEPLKLVNVRLPESMALTLKLIADTRKITVTEVVMQAITAAEQGLTVKERKRMEQIRELMYS